MGALLHISLINGIVPSVIEIAAFVALALAVLRPGFRWWTHTVALALITTGVIVVVARLVRVTAKVDNGFPWSFLVWAALPVFALAIAVRGWRGAAPWRRIVSVASVVLLAAFCADTIDAFYAYRPTLGDALGAPLPDARPAHASLVSLSSALPDHGMLVNVPIPSSTLFKPRPAVVWLPPAYIANTATNHRWPVVILLAGVPGDPVDMVRAGGAAEVADAYAAAHDGLAPIMVMPDQNGGFFRDTECVDGPRGYAETYLMHDVRSYMQQHYNASLDGRQWGIVGFSEGGTCALTLPLRAPGAFGAFLDIGGDVQPNAASGRRARVRAVRSLYGGHAAQWRAHSTSLLMQAYPSPSSLLALFADGRADLRHYRDGLVLSAAMQRDGFQARFVPLAGGHNFRMVHSALTALLPSVDDYVSLRTADAGQA